MKNKEILIILFSVLAFGACSSPKPTAEPKVSPFARKPIKEVTEARLKTDGLLIDALALQESGRFDEALSAFAAITASDPTEAVAWYEQGQLLARKGWIDSARRCCERAVAANGANTWYLLALARMQGASGLNSDMAATWERIVAQNPDVLDYYYQLSNAYLAANNLESAVEVLNRVERRVGVTEAVSLQKQRLWDAAGKHDRATREVEALADAMPQEKRYQSLLAQMYMQEKKYAKAKRFYDRILAADPQDEYIHVQLAEYYKAVGKPTEADSEMVRAFANPRLAPRTKLQLLSSFYNEDEFYNTHRDVCFRLLEQTVKESDDPREYAVLYGDVLMRQERYDEAALQLRSALQRDSSQYALWEALLICLASAPGQDEAMVDYARRASRLFPMHTLPLYLQGLYAVRNEHYADALPPLERANKWGFSRGYLEAETVELMAEAYYRTGQYDRAWAAFERYIKLRPDDWNMLNNYAYYLSEQKERLDEALAMSRRTIDAEPDNANSLDTYAWILHLLGRDGEALPYMRKAVTLDPDSETLRNHLKTIEQQ